VFEQLVRCAPQVAVFAHSFTSVQLPPVVGAE
jgi:hypothetical protein